MSSYQKKYQQTRHFTGKQRKKINYKFSKSILKNYNNLNNKNDFSYFCHKKYIILDDQTKKGLIEQFMNRFKFNGIKIEQLTNINNLNPNYLVSFEKSNKINCLLFITTYNNKKYSVFMIGNDIYSVKFRFDSELYNGTLISGEISKNKKDCWIFYVNDMIYYLGNYVQLQQLSNRLELCHDFIRNKYAFDDFMNVCHVQMKSYFIFNHLKFVKKDCRLIFHPEYSNNLTFYYDIKFEDKENKISKKEKQFLITRIDENTYNMFILETKEHFDLLGITSIEMSNNLTKIFKNKNNLILNCKYSNLVQSWLPILN